MLDSKIYHTAQVTRMRTTVRFLATYRWLTAILIAGYLWLVMTNHQNVQNALRSWQYDLPRGAIGYGMYYATAGALLLLSVFMLRIRSDGDGVLAAYWIFGAALAAGSYVLLMFSKTELPHFPQYAIMAFLVYPLCGSVVETVWWTTCLGAIDEWYQWQILFPERPSQYDFNDVYLNTIGAILGVVLLLRLLPREVRPRMPHAAWARRLITFPAVRVMLAAFVAAMLLYGTGKLALYPRQAPHPWMVLSRRGPRPSRWVKPSTTLEKWVLEMRPLDGAVLLLVTHLCIAGLDRRLQVKR